MSLENIEDNIDDNFEDNNGGPMTKKTKVVADSQTTMTEMIMPNETNPLGNLMGGNLMRWMDIAGGVCAGKHCEAHVVTVSVDHISFTQPIHVGHVITITATVTRAFNSSVEVYLEVHVADITGKNVQKSNHAYMTFVAVDQHTKKPKKVPTLTPITAEQKRLYDSAQRRRELRLILGGRMQPKDALDLRTFFAEFGEV